MVYQDVTRCKDISAAAKGLYAYLSSFCGTSDECYPSVDTILSEMGMGKDTFYKHINSLVAVGVVEKRQVISDSGKFGRTIYKLIHEVTVSEKSGFPNTENPTTVLPTTENKDTNNNILNSNNTNIKNNSYSCAFEQFWGIYPRKKEKAKAYKCYQARLRDGFSEDELLKAATAYSEECRKDRRQEQYIKLGSTFLSASTPFTDYLNSEMGGMEDVATSGSFKL